MQKPISHPFRVGEMYANRIDQYEVIEITPPTMTVRFHSDNRLVVADIAISARIWENMQSPPESSEPEPPPRQSAAGKPAAKPRATAAGKPAAKPRASAASKPDAEAASKPAAAPRRQRRPRSTED